MSEEVELQKMVVRLLGDNKDLLNKLSEVRKATEEFASIEKKAEAIIQSQMTAREKSQERYAKGLKDLTEMKKQGLINQDVMDKELQRLSGGSIWQKAAGGVQTFADKTRLAMSGVKATTDLMEGNFSTAGEALGKIGGIASAIPGPWGQAAGSIIGVLGTVVDFIDRKLVASANAAKDAFMSVATGARTINQSMRDIGLSVMTSQLEKIVELSQSMHGERGVVSQTMAGAQSMVGMGEEFQISRIPQMIEQRRAFERRLLNDPRMTRMRTEIAAESIGGELESRPIEVEERMAHRRQQQAMRAPARGAEGVIGAEARLAQEIRRLEVTRLRRQVGMETLTDAQAELLIQRQLITGTEAMTREMRYLRAEHIRQELVEKTDQHVEQMRELRDNTVHLTAIQSRASDLELKGLEARLKIERELRTLHDRGATDEQIHARRFQLNEAENVRAYNEALSASNAATQAADEPITTLNIEMDRLNQLLGHGNISLRTYATLVQNAERAFEQASPAMQAWNSLVAQGEQIWSRYEDPLIKAQEEVRALDAAFLANRITAEQHAIGVRRIQDAYDGLNEAIRGVQGTAARSADAFARARDYMRAITLRPSDITIRGDASVQGGAAEAQERARREANLAGEQPRIGEVQQEQMARVAEQQRFRQEQQDALQAGPQAEASLARARLRLQTNEEELNRLSAQLGQAGERFNNPFFREQRPVTRQVIDQTEQLINEAMQRRGVLQGEAATAAANATLVPVFQQMNDFLRIIAGQPPILQAANVNG